MAPMLLATIVEDRSGPILIATSISSPSLSSVPPILRGGDSVLRTGAGAVGSGEEETTP